jgi:hypothetical protein
MSRENRFRSREANHEWTRMDTNVSKHQATADYSDYTDEDNDEASAFVELFRKLSRTGGAAGE